jgi:hypothetical protein
VVGEMAAARVVMANGIVEPLVGYESLSLFDSLCGC